MHYMSCGSKPNPNAVTPPAVTHDMCHTYLQSTTTATISYGIRRIGTHLPASSLCMTACLPNTFHAIACLHNLGHHGMLFQLGTIMHIHALFLSHLARQSAIIACGGKHKFHSHAPSCCCLQSCASAKADAGLTASGSQPAAVYRAHCLLTLLANLSKVKLPPTHACNRLTVSAVKDHSALSFSDPNTTFF